MFHFRDGSLIHPRFALREASVSGRAAHGRGFFFLEHRGIEKVSGAQPPFSRAGLGSAFPSDG
jgi:hypothetical protein